MRQIVQKRFYWERVAQKAKGEGIKAKDKRTDLNFAFRLSLFPFISRSLIITNLFKVVIKSHLSR